MAVLNSLVRHSRTLLCCLSWTVAATAWSADSVVESDWQPWAYLPATEQAGLAPYCTGGFVAQPVLPPPSQTPSIEFNQGEIREDGSAQLLGDIRLWLDGLNAEAEKLTHDRPNNISYLSDAVTLRLEGIALSGDSGTVSHDSNEASLNIAQFVIPSADIHGEADSLKRGSETINAQGIRFTRCAPGDNAWWLVSARLEIDEEEEVARAWHSQLKVQHVPVLYVPYISFALNDQPRTGLLIPTFGASVLQPYYLHLSDQYDTTLGLEYQNDEGWFLHDEFRFLTRQHNGITDAVLQLADTRNPDEATSSDQRWSIQHRQSGQLTDHLGYDINTRWVSDRAFDVDLVPGKSEFVDHQRADLGLTAQWSELRLTGDLEYKQPVADSSKKFQTLTGKLGASDNHVSTTLQYDSQFEFNSKENPAAASDYAQLKVPDWQVHFKNNHMPFGLQTSETIRYTQFSRALPDNLASDLSGDARQLDTQTNRWHAQATIARPTNFGPLSITPSASGYVSHYRYENDLYAEDEVKPSDERFTHLAWTSSIDNRLTFDATSVAGRHRFEPRIYYAYAPLTQQQAPILEGEADSDFTLFTDKRFDTIDRIGDLQRLSVGLNYSWIETSEKEATLNLGLSKGVQLGQERLTTETEPTEEIANYDPVYSDWFLTSQWQATEALALTAKGQLDHEEAWLWNSFELSADYRPSERVFVNGQYHRSDEGDELSIGFYHPLNQRLAAIGYSAWQTQADDPTLSDFNRRQSLIGLDVDSCCWNIRFAMLQTKTATDEDENETALTNATWAPYFEFTLKGIGAGAGTIESILNRLDFGYAGRLFKYR